LKYFTSYTSITECSGKLVDDKFLPVINPAMLMFKPEMRNAWDSAVTNVSGYTSGSKVDLVIDSSVAIGIQDTQEANAFIRDALAYHLPYVALDSETSALYPRDGHIIGISLSYDGKKGAYIDTECFDEETEALLQALFSNKTVIFHNAKFDLAFFEYHFRFKFPKFEDTMLLHYLIDENPGTHGLK